MSKRKCGILIVLVILITMLATFIGATAFYTGQLGLPTHNYSKLDQAYAILQSKYYKDFTEETAMEGAVKGLVDSLGDPYTSYMNKKEWDDFNTMMTGSYSGIGVTITADAEDNTIVVVSPFKNSPAAQAGIVTGDKIIKVEGEDVFGDTMDAAVAKMKGEPGTSVNITVLKKDSGEAQDLTVMRDDIQMETVYSEMQEEFGYIQISMFDINTGFEFEEHLNDVIAKGAKGLIIDLRQNGGGVTSASEYVADCLLDKGLTIYYTRNKAGEEEYFKTKTDGVDLPVVVLVDEGTASASEILSAAIQDHKRGVLVGKKTFGKGLVQQPFTLHDGSVIKVTIESYFTPNGTDINTKGIQPDYEVELTQDGQTDDQLQKAIELLKQK